jgi:hypothetical protein
MLPPIPPLRNAKHASIIERKEEERKRRKRSHANTHPLLPVTPVPVPVAIPESNRIPLYISPHIQRTNEERTNQTHPMLMAVDVALPFFKI